MWHYSPVRTDACARERVATNKRIARQPPANHRQVVSSVYTCLAALHCVRDILLFLPGLKCFLCWIMADSEGQDREGLASPSNSRKRPRNERKWQRNVTNITRERNTPLPTPENLWLHVRLAPHVVVACSVLPLLGRITVVPFSLTSGKATNGNCKQP